MFFVIASSDIDKLICYGRRLSSWIPGEGQRHINVIEVPSLPDLFDNCVPLRLIDSNPSEIELCPEQKIQEDGFAIRCNLADEVHRAVVERLGHRDELAHSISPLQPGFIGHAALETASEVRSINTDRPLNRSIEFRKLFGWNPIFHVCRRANGMRLEIS